MHILALCTILCTVTLYIICYKKIDNSKNIYDEKISPVLEKMGNNQEITNLVLQHLSNYTTKVEKNKEKNEKISYYNVNNDKIIIKDTEDLKDCTRLIHVSHECIHSIQSKKMLKLHYIFSNINILYFLATFIYFFYNKNSDIRLALLFVQMAIFLTTFVLKIITESDASYRAPEVAIEFMTDKVDKDTLNKFRKQVREELYPIMPMFYFSLFMQGAVLLIINQVAAILI